MSDRACTSNKARAAIITGSVVQGRDITIALPAPAKPAVAGLPIQPLFVGRDQELNELIHVLKPASPMLAGPASATVTGLGGVGKTALAVQAAHHAVESGWFPGGVIFVDLQGYDTSEQRPDATDTLETLLQAIGVTREQIPNGRAARELLWRSALSERAAANLSTLILLDNASSSEQVQPFLAGGEVNRFLITSRHSLGVQGSRVFNLSVLSPRESLDQLRQELTAAYPNDERCSIESGSAAQLVELCDRLPLAVHIAAALLAITPDRPLSDLVDAMRDEKYRLSELTFDGNLAVRAAFDLSYTCLDGDQAHLFRMMTINPGVDVGIEAIAALCDFDVPKTRRVLTQLARAHLVFVRGFKRWKMHDLVRAYASEHASSDPGYREALGRMLSYYLKAAKNADSHLCSVDVNSTRSSTDFDTYESALAWLDAECQSIASSVNLALAHEQYAYALDLPAVMCNFFHMRQRWSDWIATHRAALTASLELGDLHKEARTRNNLGIAYRETGLHSEAIEEHREASNFSPFAGISQRGRRSRKYWARLPGIGGASRCRRADRADVAVH
ncbi:NB-ARC domain-containing protein [Amycolatopsis sp. NPDC051102]|uniref:ATP-binding protein n=1 Tax=Amycolatopsis sp. NPDC051102 TaxID=3155163 RepID=UPI00341ABBD5